MTDWLTIPAWFMALLAAEGAARLLYRARRGRNWLAAAAAVPRFLMVIMYLVFQFWPVRSEWHIWAARWSVALVMFSDTLLQWMTWAAIQWRHHHAANHSS